MEGQRFPNGLHAERAGFCSNPYVPGVLFMEQAPSYTIATGRPGLSAQVFLFLYMYMCVFFHAPEQSPAWPTVPLVHGKRDAALRGAKVTDRPSP